MIALLARERALAALGLALLAAALPTALALALDDRLVAGAPALLKPLKFQLSLGVHALTLALCLALLDPAARGGRLARWSVAIVIAATLFEAVWITGRGAFGLPSHFAPGLLGSVMYGLMGLGATLLVLATAALGLLLLRRPAEGADPALARAAGFGLLAAGLLGLVTGWAISLRGGPLVGAPGGAGLPLLGWSGTAGDLRTAHFLALHAAQAIPLLALALRPGRAALAGATLAWSALALAAMGWAFAGRPAIPFA